jgi:hypothetical protein
MSETKFAAFITEKKLNPHRLIAASHKLEMLTREDRMIKLAKRQAKKGDAPAEGEKKELGKPRSGRAVTPRALDAALKGGAISGPTKQRILRAVNHLLEQKKQERVELKQLF